MYNLQNFVQNMSQFGTSLIDTTNFIEYNCEVYKMYIGGICSGTKRT